MIFHVDTRQVMQDLDDFDRDSAKAVDLQFEAIGRRIWGLVYEERSFKGFKLRQSIRYKKRSENTLLVYTDPKFDHASYVNDGTRAHAIHARKAKFLRFEIGGVVHFRRSVWHPGTKPTHFFDIDTLKAVSEATPQLERRLIPVFQRFNR